MTDILDQIRPGMTLTVTQQIPQRDGTCWTTAITGTVVRSGQSKTGAWFAHSKHDKLWLDRLTLQLPDGEITDLILDEFTHIEIDDGSPLREAT